MAKVYKTPIDPPVTDYSNYDHNKEQAKEAAWIEKLRKWLADNGHKSKYSGQLLHFPIADGSAVYMVVNTKPTISLFHLAIGDAWQAAAATLRGLKVSDIENQIKFENMFSDIRNENDDFLQRQPVGTILHYHNGFNSYVRREVVLHEGKKHLKDIALVGDWRGHDLPSRSRTGEIYYPYNAKHVIDGELSDGLQVSTTYESPKFERKGRIDPRQLQPINLQLPPQTADEERIANLWKLVENVKEILNNHQENDPLKLLQAVKRGIAGIDAAGLLE